MKTNECYESLVVEANVNVVIRDDEDVANETSPAGKKVLAGDTLTVTSPDCAFSDTAGDSPVYLPYNPVCKSYRVNDGGSLTLPSSMKYVPEMTIDVYAGRVVADAIDTYKLILNTSSGAKVTLGGHANVLIAENTSGSQCDCRYLVCGGVKALVNSGAQLEVTVHDRIVADSSNGAVTYHCLRNDVQAECRGNVTKKIIELK